MPTMVILHYGKTDIESWDWQEMLVHFDAEDEPLVSGHTPWRINPAGYVYVPASKPLLMHRLIAAHNKPSRMHVHHINGNKLDNRRENLLILSAKDHAFLHNIQRGEKR